MVQERHLEVRRTARYHVLGEPSPEVADVWFACHGYGQLASEFAAEFECIEAPGRLIVVPEGLSRFYLSDSEGFHGPDARIGATWMTREDREAEISDYVHYLDDLYDEVFRSVEREAARVSVLGFSQGGATANRWVTRGRARADRLVMWGCLLASDSDLNHAATFFRNVELSIIYGTRDRFADTGMVAGYEKLLAEKSVPYRLETFEGGHRMDRDTLRKLASERPTRASL